MDLLLGSFADAHLAGFSAEQLDRYEALLLEGDPDLYGWVTGKEAVRSEHDNDVGDTRTILALQQFLHRLHRQPGCAGLEHFHSRRRVGKCAQTIKALRIHCRILGAGLKERIAVGDAAAFRHAFENGRATIVVLQHSLAKAKKTAMHIMRWSGRGYAINESFGHSSCALF